MKDYLKTPYFLINKKALDDGISKLKEALYNSWPNYIIGYSYKTNALPWVINYFNSQGCYAEVVSDDEYNLADSIGVKKNHRIYNGIAKNKDTFLESIRNHSIVNVDSEYEVDWLDELVKDTRHHEVYKVGVRVNFDLEQYCPGQTQCGEDGERFGFCYENNELQRIIEKIKSKGVQVTGLHLHKSSKTRMPDIYRAIAEVSVEISRKYNLKLSYIDIGGGFFGGLDTKPQFIEYFGMVASILSQQFNPMETTLVVEPGMALIGAPIDYITSVLDVKNTIRNTFVITDGSRTQIDPLMTKSTYFYDIKRKSEKRALLRSQIISGFTCMEHDRLFEVENDLELVPGDQIIYHKVGAYTMCLSPLFIKWFPEVYVDDGTRIFKVRNRWTSQEYKMGSVLE